MIDGGGVIVVGGGAVGCTIARELASTHHVILIEREGIGAGATGEGMGVIQPQFQFAHLPRAGRMALRFFEGIHGNRKFTYTERPLLNLHGADQESSAKSYVERVSDGYRTTWLSASAIENRYPGMVQTGENSPVAGGVHHDKTGWIDAKTFVETMRKNVRKRGAEIRTEVEVIDVLTENGNVVGVETDEGRVHGPRVVVAAGCHTRQLVSEHIAVPVQSERLWRCTLTNPTLNAGRVADEYPQLYIDHSQGGSETANLTEPLGTFWRPTHDGRMSVTGRMPALPNQPGTKGEMGEQIHDILVEESSRFLSGFDAHLEVGDVRHSREAVTPDRRPIIDAPGDAPSGLVLATGFSGRGLTASPVAAMAVRELLFGYGASFDLESLSLDRFTDRTADFQAPPFGRFDSIQSVETERNTA